MQLSYLGPPLKRSQRSFLVGAQIGDFEMNPTIDPRQLTGDLQKLLHAFNGLLHSLQSYVQAAALICGWRAIVFRLRPMFDDSIRTGSLLYRAAGLFARLLHLGASSVCLGSLDATATATISLSFEIIIRSDAAARVDGQLDREERSSRVIQRGDKSSSA